LSRLSRRPVNNHNNVKLITNEIGAALAQENLKPLPVVEDGSGASEVILQVDGGHIPIKDKDKRSFEALSAVAYRPENIQRVDKHHRAIERKSVALSAKDDELVTIKTYTLNALKKQGMTENTIVTALADGALNCWSVVLSLEPHCKQLLCILDWFHIDMRFQNVGGTVEDAYKETLERVKWTLWHDKPDEALSKLKILMTNVLDDQKRSKLEKLYDYLKNNKAYLVNYEEREQQDKTYTSQVAEYHIESIINDRYKNSKKMQWTREGAHNVLQIRGMITSNEWDDSWQNPVLSALVNAA
jgi:hypothetical protein